jgi:predicted RNase H-like HicB family nuclease
MNDDVSASIQEGVDFFLTLARESDRGCALVAAAFLEDRLGILLSRAMVSDRAAADLLEDRGPLGTFSSRIDAAYGFGLIGPHTRSDLHIVRRIRNDFAHELSVKGFDQESVAARCQALRCAKIRPDPDPRLRFIVAAALLLAAIEGHLLVLRRPKEAADESRDRRSSIIAEVMFLRVQQAARVHAGALAVDGAEAELKALLDNFMNETHETRGYAVLIRIGDEEVTATVPDLSECKATGQSVEDAESNARDAIEEWILAADRAGRPIPFPDLRVRTVAVEIPPRHVRIGRDS